MVDERDPTTTVIIAWLTSIRDGVASDKRTVSDVHAELRDVASAARDVGLTQWADKIEIAANSVRDTGPPAIIDRLTEDLHTTLLEAARAARAKGRQPPA